MLVKILFYILGLMFLLGCGAESSVTNLRELQSNAVNYSFISPDKKTEDKNVEVIGDFTNIKSDGEHQSGYSIRFWKSDNEIYGILFGSGGLRLIGSFPAGILENVVYDSKSNKISFQAKVLTSILHDSPDEYIPSWTFYEFEGILAENNLKGTMKSTDELCGNNCPDVKEITLKRSKKRSSEMEEFQTIAEWKEFANKITFVEIPK